MFVGTLCRGGPQGNHETTDREPRKSVEELIEKFKLLVEQANEIRQQMKDLTRQIEAHTGPLGRKSSHEMDVPKE